MRRWLAVWLLICPLVARAAEPEQAGAKRPYRTDTIGQDLPWYKITPGEFPPLDSAHQVSGELVEADFVHRTGQFRRDSDGQLVNFTLPPFGTVAYLNAGADPRDVPLGTHLIFFLFQDENGTFSQAATIRDDYTQLAKEGLSYRLDAANLGEGKLRVTRHGEEQKQIEPVSSELKVDAQTKVWKGSEQVKLADLTPGDELLINFAGGSPSNTSRVSEIWIGAETQHLATETQRKRHLAFLKVRGLPARIDGVDKKKVTVTFLGDPAEFEALCKDENFCPHPMGHRTSRDRCRRGQRGAAVLQSAGRSAAVGRAVVRQCASRWFRLDGRPMGDSTRLIAGGFSQRANSAAVRGADLACQRHAIWREHVHRKAEHQADQRRAKSVLLSDRFW